MPGKLDSFIFAPSDALSDGGRFNQAVARADGAVQEAAEAFKSNIEGARATVGVPYIILDELKWLRRVDERIKRLRRSNREDEWPLAFSRTNAEADVRHQNVLKEIEEADVDGEVSRALEELLRQGIVLTWSSVEVFARDFFVAALNQSEFLAAGFVTSKTAKELFRLDAVSMKTLSEMRFNLSGRIGDITGQRIGMTKLRSITAALRAVFPDNADVAQACEAPQLKDLSMRRNLIVHQRAVVDAVFFKHCGDQPIGSRLSVTAQQFQAGIDTARDFATVMLQAFASELELQLNRHHWEGHKRRD